MYSLKGNILKQAIGALAAYSSSHVFKFYFSTALQGQVVIESVCVAFVWDFSVVFSAVEKK